MKKNIKFILISLVLTIIVICYIQFYSSVSINIGSSEWWISHHNYIITDWDSKDVYIITKNKWFIHYDRYNVKKNGTINITLNENTEFIVSLYCHIENKGFKWKISNIFNPNILNYSRDGYMEPPFFKMEKSFSTGGSTRRQNIYLKTLNKGNDKIDTRYVFEGDIDKIKATDSYDNVMSQQFDFQLIVKVK